MKSIFDIPKTEHDKTLELFKQAESKGADHGNVFPQIGTELTIHMDGEERLLYPVLKEKESTRDKTLEGWEEHTYIKIVLNDLVGMPREDERWEAKLTVLPEMVEHHIEDEEENLFKKAKKVISKEQADQIATDYTRENRRWRAPCSKNAIDPFISGACRALGRTNYRYRCGGKGGTDRARRLSLLPGVYMKVGSVNDTLASAFVKHEWQQ